MALIKTIPTGSPYYTGNNDIGDISNDSGNTFEVNNITISDIRSVLGEDTYDLGKLCTSPNINQWALFKPNGASPYDIADFAGYNHQANPTTYFYNAPVSGEYHYNTSSAVYFPFIVKRGEKPPTGSASWDYIRVKAVVTGDYSGTFYSPIQEATTAYNNHVVTITLPDRTERNLSITFTAEYVTSSGSYIKDAECGSYSLTANCTYDIAYTFLDFDDANDYYDCPVKVYYNQGSYSNGNWNTYTSVSSMYSNPGALLHDDLTSVVMLSIGKINPDISTQYFFKSFKKLVVYHNGSYWECTGKSSKATDDEIHIGTDAFDGWYKIGVIPDGNEVFKFSTMTNIGNTTFPST